MLALSCKKDMEQVVIELPLTEFDTLTLNSAFTVYITQGKEFSMKMEGAKVIIDEMDVNLKKFNLTITNKYKEEWLHPRNNKVKLYITIKKINRIIANATCNIQSTNTLIGDEFGLAIAGKLNEANITVNCNYFYYWNNPPSGGRIKLSGSTKAMKLHNEGLMSVDAHDFISDVVRIQNWSKGDCIVTATDSITYAIKNSGNIYVSGNPPTIIQKEQSSDGKLIIQ